LVSASVLARVVGPPLTSALIRIEWADDQPGDRRLAVRLDGQVLSADLCEWIRIDERTRLLIIRGEAFPWVSTSRSCSRLELFLEDRGVLAENIEVEGFQAA
jgi:hypothetical protein